MSASQESQPLVLRIGHDELVIRRRYEIVSIANDLLIAGWFLVGSLFFLDEQLVTVGTWLFVLGSAQLAVRPAIRLRRRIHLRKLQPSGAPESARDF